MSNIVLAHGERLTLADIKEHAELFFASGMFADVQGAAQAAVKIMAGNELGFSPFASMTGIHIIKGRVSLGVHLLAARIKASGRYDYRVVRMDDTACVIDFYQGETKIGTASFTVDDANKAKLTNNPTWTSYRQDMLYARAMSRGAKRYCPDAINGLDVGDGDDDYRVIEPRTTQPAPQLTPAEVVDVLRGAPGDDTLTPEPPAQAQQPAAPTSGTNGSAKAKRASVSASQWNEAGRQLAARVPYYQKDGKPDWYHLTGVAGKLGHAEITDNNLAEVVAGLESYAAQQADAEAQAAQPEPAA